LLLPRCCVESNLVELVNFDKCHSPTEGLATYGGVAGRQVNSVGTDVHDNASTHTTANALDEVYNIFFPNRNDSYFIPRELFSLLSDEAKKDIHRCKMQLKGGGDNQGQMRQQGGYHQNQGQGQRTQGYNPGQAAKDQPDSKTHIGEVPKHMVIERQTTRKNQPMMTMIPTQRSKMTLKNFNRLFKPCSNSQRS
jgi:hypothetical protein